MRERGDNSMCAGGSMQERKYIREGKNEMLTKPETEKVCKIGVKSENTHKGKSKADKAEEREKCL